MPELAREVVLLSITIGGEETEYDLPGEEVEDRVGELMALYTRSRVSEILISAKRVKRRGNGG
jgi:hypothetical protein